MLLRSSSRSLRGRVPSSLFRSRMGSAFLEPLLQPPDEDGEQSAAASDRERRRQERAQKATAPCIGIEGTTEYYTRQLVVVDPESSAPMQWPKKLEFSDHVIASYAQAIASLENPKHSTLKAIAATPFPAPLCTETAKNSVTEEDVTQLKHDLLIFPDHVRVHGIEPAHIPSLVTQLLQPEANVAKILESLNLPFKPLEKGHHILVCAHENRDFRCGCNGPKLLRWLQDVGAQKNVPLHLYSSSHFGGHRYAANCIAYPSGDWFGLLNEEHDAVALVDVLVDEQPLRLKHQWRGRIALQKDDQKKLLTATVA